MEVVVSMIGVVVDGATLLVEVEGSSPKVHPGCPVTQLGHVVVVRDGHEVNWRQLYKNRSSQKIDSQRLF